MKKRMIFAGVLLASILAIAGCSQKTPNENVPETQASAGVRALAEASYPETAPYPDEMSYFDEKTGEWDSDAFSEDYDTWWSEKRALMDLPEADGQVMKGFSKNSIRQFLSESGGENRIFSPVNVYIALAMLAETTDGNSRQQILDLLEAEDIETLRTRGENIWKLCYSDDGAVTSILADSIWLRDDMDYDPETLKLLAEHYFASSYSGRMGSEEYDKKLQEWLNEQTGGLLKEQAAGIRMSPETVMALASAIYYKAKWQAEFDEGETREDTFHGAEGDVSCDFMHSSNFSEYYWADQFSAAALSLNESGRMWIILPDEGTSLDEILAGEDVFELIGPRQEEWENTKYLKVNLALPKFDAASDLDLIAGLKELGITDIFHTETADFTPLCPEADDLFLSQARHAARVKIDEQGIEAAAYTVMMAAGSAMPPDEEVDFVVDRPFLFVITSRSGLPLFAGTVNQI